MKLNERQIAAIRPTGKRQFVTDDGTPGLRLKIEPTGSKSWLWKGRPKPGAAPIDRHLGRYPGMTLEKARAAARGINALRDQGISIIEQETETHAAAAKRAADTFDAQWKSYMSAEGSKGAAAAEKARVYTREIEPKFGARSIHDIRRADVRELLNEKAVTAPVQANRLLAHVKRFGNWCVENDVLEANFAANIKMPSRENARNRHLNDEELRWFWSVTETMSEKWRAIFRLQLLLGARRSEILGLSWSEIDANAAMPMLCIPADRIKTREPLDIPLPPLAYALVKGMMPDGKKPATGLIFHALGNADSVISGDNTAWEKLFAKVTEAARHQHGDKFQVPRFTMHDLRRTASTRLAQCRVDKDLIRLITNHSEGSKIDSTYNRYRYRDEILYALSLLETHIIEVIARRS